MQICKDHWEKLRDRIKGLGIYHLIAQSGEEAHRQMVDQLQGAEDPNDYDPLMSCNWMICSHALRQGGIQLMMAKEDGTARCPICEAWVHRHDGALPGDKEVTQADFDDYWINGPTNAALAECRKRGLVPAQQ